MTSPSSGPRRPVPSRAICNNLLHGRRIQSEVVTASHSVVERQGAARGEFVQRRSAFDLGALDPGRFLEAAGLHAHRADVEASTAFDVLGVQLGYRRGV